MGLQLELLIRMSHGSHHTGQHALRKKGNVSSELFHMRLACSRQKQCAYYIYTPLTLIGYLVVTVAYNDREMMSRKSMNEMRRTYLEMK